MSPQISCILPAYNAGQFLEEAVRSVFSQTMSDWELIVIDDGSTDATGEILRRLSAEDSRLKVLTQENTGIVGALNEGLRVASGQFIARMDADDVSYPSRFQQQYDFLVAHPECVLVGGVALASRFGEPREGAQSGGGHLTTDISRFPPRIAVSVHPLIMVRHDALQQIGGYRKEYPHAEDHDLYIRLAQHGAIVNLPVDLLFYRRHPGQVSARHLELQERSAARAEKDAFEQARGRQITPMMFEAYVFLRLWRRQIAVDSRSAVMMLPKVAIHIARLTGAGVWSREYLNIRLIFAANMVWLIRRMTGSAA